MTATLTPDLYERLLDRLRHVVQYTEAARVTAEEAIRLLEATKEGEDDA